MRAYIKCALCEKMFECNIKESAEECAKKHDLCEMIVNDTKNNYTFSYYICRNCFFVLYNLNDKNYKIIREKKRLPHIYVPKSFKKFAIIKLE